MCSPQERLASSLAAATSASGSFALKWKHLVAPACKHYSSIHVASESKLSANAEQGDIQQCPKDCFGDVQHFTVKNGAIEFHTKNLQTAGAQLLEGLVSAAAGPRQTIHVCEPESLSYFYPTWFQRASCLREDRLNGARCSSIVIAQSPVLPILCALHE